MRLYLKPKENCSEFHNPMIVEVDEQGNAKTLHIFGGKTFFEQVEINKEPKIFWYNPELFDIKPLKDKFNHLPCDLGIWFPYNTYRYKMYYDIKLKTGEIVENCYPNAVYFMSMDTGKDYHDDDVAEVCLTTINDEIEREYKKNGIYKIVNNFEMFDNLIVEV